MSSRRCQVQRSTVQKQNMEILKAQSVPVRLSELLTGLCDSQDGRQVCPPENVGGRFAILEIVA